MRFFTFDFISIMLPPCWFRSKEMAKIFMGSHANEMTELSGQEKGKEFFN